MLPKILAVGVGVMVSMLLLLEPPLHYGEGKCCPFFSCLCRRYAAHFTAVGADFYSTTRVKAVRISADGVGVMLPILLPLV